MEKKRRLSIDLACIVDVVVKDFYMEVIRRELASLEEIRRRNLMKKSSSSEEVMKSPAEEDLNTNSTSIAFKRRTAGEAPDYATPDMPLASTDIYSQTDQKIRVTGSKKARLLVNLASSQGTSGPSDVKSSHGTTMSSSRLLLSMDHQLNLPEQLVKEKSKAKLVNSTINNSIKCIICCDVSQQPCAARCGHICCAPCWTQWLRVNQTCPSCRKPASADTISNLVIKHK